MLPTLCGVPNGLVGPLVSANTANCPSGVDSCCARARHGALAKNPPFGVTPLDAMLDTSALWARNQYPSEPSASVPAGVTSCNLNTDAQCISAVDDQPSGRR
eukprot:1723795-Pyramimonas_sp.AAC.1